MSKVELYECDHCGDRFGAANDVAELDVQCHHGREMEGIFIHICHECAADIGGRIPLLTGHVTVIDGEVTSIMVGETPPDSPVLWSSRERGADTPDGWEPFFNWLEGSLRRFGV